MASKLVQMQWKSAPAVSVSMENSWGPRHFHESIQKGRFNARFQKKQLQEKEEKLLKLYENQQQRAIDRIGKNTGSVGSTPTNSSNLLTSTGGGKVRQMFDERRQKAGIDRSYPLEPLKQENVANMVAVAPSKTGLRTNTNKTSNTTILTSRPSNGIYGSKSNNRQTITHSRSYQTNSNVISTVKGNIANSFSNNDYVNDVDVVDNMDRFSIEDDMDDNYNGVDGKLANLGGKLPSEILPKSTDTSLVSSRSQIHGTNGLKASSTFKKEIKAAPFPKSTSNIKPSASPVAKLPSRPPSSVSSSSSSMSRPQSRPGQSSARSAPAAPSSDRTPNTQRPSSKQTPRGPSAVQRDDLDECRHCHRRFASDRLATHEDICARTAKKKRKQYDATKHRLEGTDLVQFTGKPSRKDNSKTRSISEVNTSKNKMKTSASKANNWRQKHEEFIAAIRSAKMAQQHVAKGGKLSDLPPPPPSSNPDYVQCPHCGRRFNETAAQRHIPKCASYDYNKSKPGPNKGKAR